MSNSSREAREWPRISALKQIPSSPQAVFGERRFALFLVFFASMGVIRGRIAAPGLNVPADV